jgi:hypothetical protein
MRGRKAHSAACRRVEFYSRLKPNNALIKRHRHAYGGMRFFSKTPTVTDAPYETVAVHSNHARYRRKHGRAVSFQLFQQQFFGGFSVFRFTLSAAIALWYFVERPSYLRARMIKVRGGVRVWEQQ